MVPQWIAFCATQGVLPQLPSAHPQMEHLLINGRDPVDIDTRWSLGNGILISKGFHNAVDTYKLSINIDVS
jgi:hypothetical protein